MKKTAEEIGFNIFALIVITIFAALCILPILYTISGSFTPEQDLAMGLKLIPERFTLDAYRLVLKDPTAMLRAYGVTIRLVILDVYKRQTLWLPIVKTDYTPIYLISFLNFLM